MSVTDLPAVALGCSALGGLYHPMTDAEAEALLSAAWEQGIRYFDTAPHYGHGMSEHRLGHFLRGQTGYRVSTKVGRILKPAKKLEVPVNGFHSVLPFEQHYDYTYDGIMRSAEDSLNRLGLNKVDVLYVHDIGDPGVATNTPEYMAQLTDSGHRALSQLKREGVTQEVGLGVNTVEACLDLVGKMEIDKILLAGRYTLLDRSATSALLPLCQEHGIRIVIGGVFNSGILATGATDGAYYDYAPASAEILAKVRQIESLCARHGVPLAAAALQFPARNEVIVSTLLGTSKVSSLMRNLSLLEVDIPEQLWSDLEMLGAC